MNGIDADRRGFNPFRAVRDFFEIADPHIPLRRVKLRLGELRRNLRDTLLAFEFAIFLRFVGREHYARFRFVFAFHA